MLKRFVSGIMLTLLLVSISTFAFNVQPVKAQESPIEIWSDYTLTRDIVFSEDGFIVKVDNIVLDLNGHTIRGYSSGDYKGVLLVGRKRVVVKNGIIEGFYRGIFLQDSHFNRIENNKLYKNEWGIFADSSNNNVIEGNLVYETTGDGIICPKSHYNIIRENVAHHNKEGIDVAYPDGSNNIVEKNKVYSNDYYGIHLHKTRDNLVRLNVAYDNLAGIKMEEQAQGNTVDYNHVYDNGGGIDMFFDSGSNFVMHNLIEKNIYGSYIIASNENSISQNAFSNNQYGIRSIRSDANRILHNNFVGNTIQVLSEQSVNEFDDGYPSGGNYWKDYTGVDEFHGPNQDIPGSDGIGDTLYVIDENNQDNYPFIFRIPRRVVVEPLIKEGDECPDYSKPKDGDINGDGRNDWFYRGVGPDDQEKSIGLWGIDPTSRLFDEYFAVIFSGEYLVGKCPFSGGMNDGYVRHTGDVDKNGKIDRLVGSWWLSVDGGTDDVGTPIWPGFVSVEGEDSIEFEFSVKKNELRVTHYDESGNVIKSKVGSPSEPSSSWVWEGEPVVEVPFEPGESMEAQPSLSVDFDPDTLNLDSKGKFVTVYIELPIIYNISNVDVSTISMDGTISVDLSVSPTTGDHDNDTIPDLMVKFDRMTVVTLFEGLSTPSDYVIEVTGTVIPLTVDFKVTDTIRIISPH